MSLAVVHDINFILWFSRLIHIGAAIIAIGGAAYMRFVLLPSAERALDSDGHRKLRETITARWRPLLYASIALLLLSGSINFVILALPPKVDPIPYHPIFGIKLVAAFAIFAIGMALVGRRQAFANVRARSRRWLTVLLVLAVLLVLVSGLLGQIRSLGTRSQVDTPATTSEA